MGRGADLSDDWRREGQRQQYGRARTSGGSIVKETKWTAGHVDQYVVSTSYASSRYRTSPSRGEPFPSAGVSKA